MKSDLLRLCLVSIVALLLLLITIAQAQQFFDENTEGLRCAEDEGQNGCQERDENHWENAPMPTLPTPTPSWPLWLGSTEEEA